MADKRKRVVLGLSQKLDIINLLRKGESARKLAMTYGIGRTTVNDIKRNAEKIEKHILKMQTVNGDVKVRKTMKVAKLEQLDTVMYEWFVQARSLELPLSGPIITAKATEMNKKLNGDPSFKASTGWLDKFKGRHGIRLDTTSEEICCEDDVVAEYWDNLMKRINERTLTREQVYNCDETCLYWRALPEKVLSLLSANLPTDSEMQTDLITIMLCANASGSHRFPLLVVGKSKNTELSENSNEDEDILPVTYYSRQNARMCQDIFQNWFHKMFVPNVKLHLESMGLPQEAMLLMDNAPCHPVYELESDDGKITCFFLPTNTPLLTQPMEQGVMECLKSRYRKDLIQTFGSAELVVEEFWKSYTFKDAIFKIAKSWLDVPEESLKRGWYKLWPDEESYDDDIQIEMERISDATEILKLYKSFVDDKNITIEEIKEWLEMDKVDGSFEMCDDDELVQSVLPSNDGESKESIASEASKIPSHAEAEIMISKSIKWFEQQEEANSAQLMILRKMRNLAAKKARAEMKKL